MKTNKLLILFVLIASILASSCSKKKKGDIVPDDMNINLSDAISIPDLEKKGFIFEDTIVSGRDLYQKLRTLIYYGDNAGTILNSYLSILDQYEITGPTIFSFINDQDGRTKNVVVTDHADFFNETWDYFMFVTDGFDEGALALYWNVNPRKAIAIFRPKALNLNSTFLRNAWVWIEYNESDQFFDRTTLIQITGMDTTSVNYMSKLKLFIGQKGDVAHIYGNTIHPTAYLVDPEHTDGRSWAFKAKNNIKLDIAVAKCALPTTIMTLDEMPVIWTTYTMDEVLRAEIEAVYTEATPAQVDFYVNNAIGLAYFIGPAGFVSNNLDVPEDPGFTNDFLNLTGLEPWTPIDVYNMIISF
ncbi:MAG: hypothetical protein U9N53_03985 [Bacteroidota bacterium]|nr:hypothetical protein [Bacteroidota bacterium]